MVELSHKWNAERSPEERKAFVDALIGAIPTPVLVKDEQHRYFAVNNAFTVFFRRSAEQILGRTDYDFFAAEDARFYQQTDTQALGHGKVVEYEHEYTLDDVVQWMLVRKSPLTMPDGGRYVVLVLIDITQRREAQQALSRSETRFRSLTALSADWYWEQDADLRFTFLSKEVGAKAGQPAGGSLGLTRWEHPGIDFTSVDWEAHKAACLAHEPFRNFTYRRVGADGRSRWLAISGEPVFDADGRFKGYLGVGREVTAEKQAAQEIRRSKDLYAALSQTNRAIIHIREEQALFEEVCNVAVEYGHFCLVWIGLLDEQTGWVVPKAIRGPASHGYPPIRVSIDPQFPEGRGYSAAVLREGRHYIVNDYFADPRVAPWAAQASAAGVRAMATLPLRRAGRCIGVLNLHGDEVDFFTEELVRLVRELADNLSFGLTNLQSQAERELAQRALRESEQRFRQLAANIPEVFWVAEPGSKTVKYVSPAYEKIWRRSIERLLNDPVDWLLAVHPEDSSRVEATFLAARQDRFDLEYRIVWPDGTVRWIHDRAFPIPGDDGAVSLVTGVAEDITDRKEAEMQLLHLAQFDYLTGLPNRLLFNDRLKQSLLLTQRMRRGVALVFIDLDHFKVVNDTMGHPVGDKLLIQVARRLEGTLRTGDTVARVGGDEFAMILPNLTRPHDAGVAVDKIMRVFEQPFELAGQEFFVTASAGIALYPEDGDDADTLTKHADTAMYHAKELGRTNYQFFVRTMNTRALERMSFDGHLRRALERGEFSLHYQPQVSVTTGDIVGLEALLRWHQPDLGNVLPDRFVPLLEENGLIVPVGEWALGEVCRQLQAWSARGLRIPRVALNLSARQIQRKDLRRCIEGAISGYGLAPELLELEITESVLMSNPEHAARVLSQLKHLGMRIALDDFGTGYSSLSYLKNFSLDALKIDRSFVKDMTVDRDDAVIVEAIIALARSLKLHTVAEGVEDADQLALLVSLGCDDYQGYYFSPPVPPEEIGKKLEERVALSN